jgi:hypothetical protein
LVGDGVEGGDRRWGGSGSHRWQWRHGVLQARVSEDDGKVVEELLHDDVVLTVSLAGAKMLCMGGSMARLSGRWNWSSSASWSGYSSGRNWNWIAR